MTDLQGRKPARSAGWVVFGFLAMVAIVIGANAPKAPPAPVEPSVTPPVAVRPLTANEIKYNPKNEQDAEAKMAIGRQANACVHGHVMRLLVGGNRYRDVIAGIAIEKCAPILVDGGVMPKDEASDSIRDTVYLEVDNFAATYLH